MFYTVVELVLLLLLRVLPQEPKYWRALQRLRWSGGNGRMFRGRFNGTPRWSGGNGRMFRVDIFRL